MNISKALKEKNRLIGQLNKIKEVLARENSRRDDSVSKIDRSQLSLEFKATQTKLVELKTAINKASVPIFASIIAMAELKSTIEFYKTLPTREGKEIQILGRQGETKEYTWNSYINQQTVDEMIKESELTINKLQDIIDDFNASTQVDYKP